MGTLLDTTVFIQLERELNRLPVERAMVEMAARLERELGADEDVGMAAITASELLHGAHRADHAHRSGREAFVEAALLAFPPLPFDLLCARAHARLWAHLARSGSDVGPHDRLVAATAVATGWRVATANVRHFERIAGVRLVSPNLAG
jgi:predicted nucleic acid-binding protein